MSSNRANTTVTSTARKRGRVVPSRYMQAAQASKNSATRNASVMSSGGPLSRNETLDTSRALWTQPSSVGNRFTSTPNSIDERLSAPLHDDSVIASHAAPSTAPVLKEPLIAPSAVKQRPRKADLPSPKQSQPGLAAFPKTGKEKACSSEYIQDIEIKNLYAMYVQAAFLESRSKKSLQVRSHNSLEQLYKVCCTIQILMHKITSTEADLTVLSHIQLLQKLLEPQEEMLDALPKDISTMLEQYSEVSSAIDTLRNNLPLSEVHVPANSNIEADLARLLEKCRTQLEYFFAHYSSVMLESANISKLLLEIKNVIGNLEKEACRLKDLLLAADGTLLTDSSLKMGEILSDSFTV